MDYDPITLICPACGIDKHIIASHWRIISDVTDDFAKSHNENRGCDITAWEVIVCHE